ncbi:odorant receptor 22c-like [Anoplophora glabripennis]|uniref:odorant receptor 22c-like n=1 Tax=Anoplophora glabripennis TaxID=217634 RepID=UPI000C77ADDD|nr:odorant receptor 22c-like [Anoplophora glabripennis]
MHLGIFVKYLALAFGTKTVKQILEFKEQFWEVDIVDKEITYLIRYLKAIERLYKSFVVLAVSAYIVPPLFSTNPSVFNCFIPYYMPFPLLYIAEVYVTICSAFLFISFNIFVSSVILLAAIQFRLVNFKVRDLNLKDIENDQDVEVYVRNMKKIVKHQQLLMRYVDELNTILSVPVALLMVTNISMICITMYNATVTESVLLDQLRTFATILCVLTESFLVYGFPAQVMMNQSEATAETIYSECKWCLPKLQHLRNDFLIMMMRSQEGVSIRAANYHIINNRTVLLIMKTAYTFYTFMQKVA